ncbi:hypothetical protein P22_1930 [Propionispora sp. 2/2-37]|uniref:hypothetical protein n=1 Tax=Propionispora sp. 2/2-37 TaxID=1677858 RepID=UPI0006C39534|nr:hypothetical protein [Propionispora sp. 2/2-37]CUH95845.1 hypothetical protein P22_1930 [Propionispora sp. 2/2-37]
MSKIVDQVKRLVAELQQLQQKEAEIKNQIHNIIQWRNHELTEEELTEVIKLTGYDNEF